nr:MAG TPA: hypothetical protein [Caudoviricetes sp.]
MNIFFDVIIYMSETFLDNKNRGMNYNKIF